MEYIENKEHSRFNRRRFAKILERLSAENESQNKLSQKTGVTRSLFTQYINLKYKVPPKISTLQKIAQGLNDMDLFEEMLDACGYTGFNAVSYIPLLGTVRAGYDYLADTNIQGEIEAPDNLKNVLEECIALKVQGDSMKPELIEGDILFVQLQNDFENGALCVVLINGDEATVKRVFKMENGLLLQAANPSYGNVSFSAQEVNEKPVKIIGIVKSVLRNY